MKKPAVLIIDDDPSHLRIYGWIIQSAGFESVSALVTFDALDLPNVDVDLVLLDYHLHGKLTATDVAKLLRNRHKPAPIFVLSDAMMMPNDIAPFVDGFIRKGDPARLVEAISEKLRCVV